MFIATGVPMIDHAVFTMVCEGAMHFKDYLVYQNHSEFDAIV